MSTLVKNAPARRRRAPKSDTSSQVTSTELSPTSSSRTQDGRFAAGNPGGPGNPHARHCARMLALLRASISDEEMVAIIRALVDKARDGDVSAAKLLLSYNLGKPMAAPNPDEIDRDEWEHFQRDTIGLDEVQQVLGSLPARLGNDMARTALPIMAQARNEELASQLVANLPKECKVSTEKEVATKQPRECAPIANRFSKAGLDPVGSPSTIHHPRSTTNDQRSAAPIPIGKSAKDGHSDRSTIHNPRSTSKETTSPIPNRCGLDGNVGPLSIGCWRSDVCAT